MWVKFSIKWQSLVTFGSLWIFLAECGGQEPAEEVDVELMFGEVGYEIRDDIGGVISNDIEAWYCILVYVRVSID